MSVYELSQAAATLTAAYELFGPRTYRQSRPGNTALRDWAESAEGSICAQVAAIAAELESRTFDHPSDAEDRDYTLARASHLLVHLGGFTVKVVREADHG